MKLKDLIASKFFEDTHSNRLVTSFSSKLRNSNLQPEEEAFSSKLASDISSSLYSVYRSRESWIKIYNQVVTVLDKDLLDVIHRSKTIAVFEKTLKILEGNYTLNEVLVFKILQQMLKDKELKLHSSFDKQDFSIKNLREYINRQLAIDINNN